jgi:SagB-type dehydrogenase family enzyme
MPATQLTNRKQRDFLFVLAVVLAAAVLSAAFLLWTGKSPSPPVSSNDSRKEVRLPPPQTRGGLPLTEALARRRSQRVFADRPLPPEAVSQLCWAAQGITQAEKGFRTAPSAGALFPIAVFLVDAAGVSEYKPQRHMLLRAPTGDLRGQLRAAAHDQDFVGQAPLCLVITMDVSRAAAKYGARAERYGLLEAGHVAQNVLLQATALGLVGTPVGAFEDDQVATLLNLPAGVRPVYLVSLGYPRAGK